ncbi:VirB8/TrbF family protein (plasmid) [Robbsia andropogonis]|uniref:VirB8/TrbF family protein n=1 Tax=Robbsia andropogonis TaxID=28092 RepID=UPI003D1A5F25
MEPVALPMQAPAQAVALTPPPGAAATGFQKYFQAYVEPRNLNLRLKQMLGGLLLVVVCQTWAIVVLSHSAGKVPYFIERDKASGAVYLSDKVATVFTPEAANKTYFLRIWVTRLEMMKADISVTVNVDHPAAFAWTIGAAKNQFTSYFDNDDKVVDIAAKYPGTSRQIIENSTSYSPDGKQAYMIITRVWSINGVEVKRDQKLLTISFIFAPETLKDGEQGDNPLGMRIKDFSVAPYYGPSLGAQS